MLLTPLLHYRMCLSALTARIENSSTSLRSSRTSTRSAAFQYTYGYFIDKSQYNEVVDLFADDVSVGSRRNLPRQGRCAPPVHRALPEAVHPGHNGPRYGWLLDHPQLQMVIDVAPDAARPRHAPLGDAGGSYTTTAAGNQRAWWEGGIYENAYVRANGVWK